MTRVLFLGGPRDGEHHDIDGLPTRLMVLTSPDPVGYTLHAWRGGHAYVADGHLCRTATAAWLPVAILRPG